MPRVPLRALQRIMLSAAAALIALLILGPAIALASEGDSTVAGMPIETLQFGSTGLVGLYTWISTNQRVRQTKHDAEMEALGKRIARNRTDAEARIAEVERRVATAEEARKHAPTAEQITDLIKTIGDLRGGVAAQAAELRALSSQVGSLGRRFDHYETHMLEAAK